MANKNVWLDGKTCAALLGRTMATLDRKINDEFHLHTYSTREESLNAFLLKLEVDEELLGAVCVVGYFVHSGQAAFTMPGWPDDWPNVVTEEIRSGSAKVFRTIGKARLEALMADLGFAINLSTLAMGLCSGGCLRFSDPRLN